jgi:hypothetical protein
MEKKTIILPELRYKQSPSEDQQIKVGLESSEELLREGDRTIILDLEEQFSKERNESKKYKTYGKIRMVFRNLYRGTAPYGNLEEYLALHGDGSNNDFSGYLPYDEFAFIRRDTYKENIEIPRVSGSTYGTYNPNIDLPAYPKNKHQNISNMYAPYHNWNLYLSYVYSGDTNYQMKYTLSGATKTEGVNIISFVSGDGIPCRIEDKTTYYKLITPVEHGFNDGEFVNFSSESSISGKTYSISSLGDTKFNSEKYVINLNKQQFSGVTLPTLVTIKRCIDDNDITGTTSNYYVHKHKTLTITDEYIMDKAGFETPIFEEERKLLIENSSGENDLIVERNRMESIIFDFKDSFILTGLTNNLDFTPTEIYLSVIFRNGSGYFEYPPKNGYRFHFHDYWIDDHFSGNTSVETTIPYTTGTTSGVTFTYGSPLPSGTTLTGAFVEYNRSELKERVISESFHRISNPTAIFDYDQDVNVTNFSGATANNKMGLIYQPHYRIKLRELSNYIETSNTNNIDDLPENVEYFQDESLWKWRDLYDHGYIDDEGNGTDFPFVNGQHYVKSDINFYFRNERYFLNKADGNKNFNSNNC